MTSPAPDLALVDAATARLIATARALTDADLAQPSLLPGWTRGHVLAHLSRNADSLVNLLLWAHTGIETPQYASPLVRDHDIEAGSGRPLDEQITDLEESAHRFAALAAKLPPAAWEARVRTRGGREVPASDIPWMRLTEVEIHHVDAGSTYTPADWSAEFLGRLLPGVAADLTAAAAAESSSDVETFTVTATDTDLTATIGAGTPARTITGPAHALTAWLLGRSPGTDLPPPLPTLPAWR